MSQKRGRQVARGLFFVPRPCFGATGRAPARAGRAGEGGALPPTTPDRPPASQSAGGGFLAIFWHLLWLCRSPSSNLDRIGEQFPFLDDVHVGVV